MVRPALGGDTTTIADGGSGLVSAAGAVGTTAASIGRAGRDAGGAGGDPVLSAALERYAAAAAEFGGAVEIQMRAAGQLASNTAADLSNAGGSR